jgi:hypothetical protein
VLTTLQSMVCSTSETQVAPAHSDVLQQHNPEAHESCRFVRVRGTFCLCTGPRFETSVTTCITLRLCYARDTASINGLRRRKECLCEGSARFSMRLNLLSLREPRICPRCFGSVSQHTPSRGAQELQLQGHAWCYRLPLACMHLADSPGKQPSLGLCRRMQLAGYRCRAGVCVTRCKHVTCQHCQWHAIAWDS